jgi:hypothetical protein
MNAIFNSKGEPIAFRKGENIFDLNGNHFANYLPLENLVIDLQGNYLGEIVSSLYLLKRTGDVNIKKYKKKSKLNKIEIPAYLIPIGFLGIIDIETRYED